MITDWAKVLPVKGVAQLSRVEDMEGIGRPVSEEALEEALEEELRRHRRILAARREKQEWLHAWKTKKKIKKKND
jgi:SOS response regulatory protein OraA/RecX